MSAPARPTQGAQPVPLPHRLDAQLATGQLCLEQGDGDGAYAAFAAVARAGDARGLNMLGRWHQCGWGAGADPRQAAGFFLRAAEQGDIWAHFNLGDLYHTGAPGLARDPARALALYAHAAEAGLAKAQNMVGLYYEDGQQIGPDLARAREFYRAAAAGGDCWGAFNLGRLALAEGQVAQAATHFANSLTLGFDGCWQALAEALEPRPEPALQAIARTARTALAGAFLPDRGAGRRR